jgi:hypothetical protein
MLRHILFAAAAAIAAAVMATGPASARTAALTERFAGDPAGTSLTDGQVYPDGLWQDIWNGRNGRGRAGSQTIKPYPGGNQLLQTSAPIIRMASGETHSVFSLSTAGYTPSRVVFEYTTVSQTRTNPHPWEVGWVIWNFRDSNHFYYVALKPNGWELGKEIVTSSGAQSQQYLATGSAPAFRIGQPERVEVTEAVSNGVPTFTVSARVNGALTRLAAVSDAGSAGNPPILSGRVGAYNEDSQVAYTYLGVDQ